MQLGIDIGTSAVKVVLCDAGALVRSASTPLGIKAPKPGWSEQDPQDWWAATLSALEQLGDLSAVQSVGLSGQMHGAVLLDAAQHPLRPAILWNDNRAIAACDTLANRCPDIGMRAGVPPLPGFTAPKLIWLKNHEPEIYAKICHILLPKDYIGLRLHGELATDYSDAAGTLWLDQARRTWCADLCAQSDTDIAWLPKLYFGTQTCGTITAQTAAQTGLRAGIPVVAGGGDAATGAISLGMTEPNRGMMSLGTSGQILVSGPKYAPNPTAFVHAFAHTVPDRWYQMAALLNGARPLAWLATLLNIPVAQLLDEAQSADPSRAPSFLPFLTGERSPLGDPHVRAGFAGLDDATSRAELAYAVVEAISLSFANALTSFGETIDGVSHFVAIGGGSQSDFLLQKIANATQCDIHRPKDAGAGAAIGAAMLACGTLPPVLESDGARFHPEQEAGCGERKAKFDQLYDRLGKGQWGA